MITEQVLKAFRELGFIPEEIECFGYRIEYEGVVVLCTEEQDETSVTLVAPGVFEITDDNRAEVLEAMAKL
ncbi:MAG: hypothetical protein ACI304_09700 [Lepagella sp.]